MSARPVQRHGGVQQPAEGGGLDDADLLAVLRQVLAVGRRHQAAAAEQVCYGRERTLSHLEQFRKVYILVSYSNAVLSIRGLMMSLIKGSMISVWMVSLSKDKCDNENECLTSGGGSCGGGCASARASGSSACASARAARTTSRVNARNGRR